MATAGRVEQARRLVRALEEGSPIPALTDDEPGLGVEEAYEIQRHVVELHERAGRRPVGWKVGLTSGELQARLGVHEPDYGVLLDAYVFPSGAVLSRTSAKLIAPRIEPELAFVIGETLEGPVTTARALAAARAVLPVFELVDSRIEDWRLRLADTVADNASAFGAVLGDGGASPLEVDLAEVDVVLKRDSETVATGKGAAVLGDPARAVVWLANALGTRGRALLPDDIVLAGSLAPAVEAIPGRYVASFGDGIGGVEITIEE